MPRPDESLISKIFLLENPFYTANVQQWQRSKAAYDGGKPYVRIALIKHMAEFKEEFAERLLRAYYFNFPRKVVRLLTQYVLSQRPQRESVDPDISEDFDRNGQRVDEVMRQFSINLRIYGQAWLQVDMPSFEGEKTKKQEQEERLRPYAIAVSPMTVKGWYNGADGKLDWVCTEEHEWRQPDPFKDPEIIHVRKLWTRTDCATVEQGKDGGTRIVNWFEHTLGAVPFIRKVESDGYGIGSPHWFEDIVSISDAILNNESEAQMTIVKQLFPLLVLPEDFVAGARARIKDMLKDEMETDERTEKLVSEKLDLVIARGVAITESEGSKNIARYISPDGVDIDKIDEKNRGLIKQLYSLCCLATDKDTKLVESADAKQWDFQAIEQHLVTHADILEQAESEAWKLMVLWKPSLKVPTLNYNRVFSVLQLTESIASLLELSGMNQDSGTYQHECGKTAVSLLNRLRQMPQDVIEKINKEIDAAEIVHPGDDDPGAEPDAEKKPGTPAGVDGKGKE